MPYRLSLGRSIEAGGGGNGTSERQGKDDGKKGRVRSEKTKVALLLVRESAHSGAI